MVFSTAMLLQQYGTYANPAAKIGRLVKNGDLIPIIKGLYEKDRTVPGYCLVGILSCHEFRLRKRHALHLTSIEVA